MMGSQVISLVWAPDLVKAVWDALVYHGTATSGDLARTAKARHDDTLGVLSSLADAGYVRSDDADGPHGEAGRMWSFTQAGRSEIVNDLTRLRAKVDDLEAAIAAPVAIAPATPMPSEWPDPTAEWPLWNPDATPGPPIHFVNVVIGGAEHKLSVTGTGDFAVALDGITVLLWDTVPPDPSPSRWQRARARLLRGRR